MTPATWKWSALYRGWHATDGTLGVIVRTPGGPLQPPTEDAATLLRERAIFGLGENVGVDLVHEHGKFGDPSKFAG